MIPSPWSKSARPCSKDFDRIIYLTSKTWDSRPGERCMALQVKIASFFGVLEYWSVGKSKSPYFNLNLSFHYSITPQLHHSSRLPQGGKSMEVPSGVVQRRVLWVRSLSFKRIEHEATISPWKPQEMPLWPQPRFLVRRRGGGGVLLGLQKKPHRSVLPLSWSAAAERWGRGLKLEKK